MAEKPRLLTSVGDAADVSSLSEVSTTASESTTSKPAPTVDSPSCLGPGLKTALRRLYDSTMRHPLRDVHAHLHLEAQVREARRRSRKIDARLREDADRWMVCNVLVYDSFHQLPQALMRALEAMTTSDQVTSLDELRVAVVRRVKHVLARAMGDLEAEEEMPAYSDDLVPLILGKLERNEGVLDDDVAILMENLWSDCSFRELYSSPLEDIITHASQMVKEDYVPGMSDRAFMLLQRGRTFETRLTAGNTSICLIDPSMACCRATTMRKWLTHFEDAPCVIFAYDLATCWPWSDADNGPFDDALMRFDRTVASKMYARSSILLLLVNASKFRAMVPKHPLREAFPQYTGEVGAEAGLAYILGRFQARVGARKLHLHVCEVMDRTNLRFLFATVKEAMLERALQDTGISQEVAWRSC